MRKMLFLSALVLLAGCGSRGPVAIPEAGELKKLPPGTHQQTIDVPTVGSVRYTIEVPAGYDGKAPVPLVLLLHYGYDGPAPKPYTGKGMIDAFRSGLSGLNAILLAPDAVGGSWTDPQNEKAVVWLARSALKTYAIDPKKVVLTGFSLGGEGAWFIGSRHQDVFTGVVPVAAPVAGSTDWKVPVYVIHSSKDEVVSYGAAKKHADAVKSKGARLQFETITGLGHYDTAAYGPHVRDAVRWLQAEWK